MIVVVLKKNLVEEFLVISTIYNKNENVCLDKDCNNIITTSVNNIEVPTKKGYTIAGYYTEADGSGTLMIDSDGYVTE